MASSVDIANRALQKIGAGRIASLDQDTKSAREISACYDILRQGELRKHVWTFATKRVQLPALSDAPAWQFGYAYQIPTDFIRLVQLNDYEATIELQDYRQAPDPPYLIEGGQILTDYGAPLKVRYIFDVTDVSAMDPLFREVLAGRLAMEIAEPITQSPDKAKLAASFYADALKEAVRANAIEKVPDGAPDDSWMLSRL